MDKSQQIEITIRSTVEIPTDEYADLLSAQIRLGIVCDFLDKQTYVDKDKLLLIARGAPLLICAPEKEKEPDSDANFDF